MSVYLFQISLSHWCDLRSLSVCHKLFLRMSNNRCTFMCMWLSLFLKFYILNNYNRLSLSRPRLSRITAYLEVKIWSLFKHENLTTDNKILWKKGEIASLFHNIFNISLTPGVKLRTYTFVKCGCSIYISSILQTWYVEVRIYRSISDSPLEFEITRVDCI